MGRSGQKVDWRDKGPDGRKGEEGWGKDRVE